MDITSISSFNPAAAAAEIRRQNTETDSFQRVLEAAAQSQDDKELLKAAKEFESYFIHMLLREMRNTIPDDDENRLFPKSHGERIFQDMLDEEKARHMTQAGGIGLAQQMFQQMRREV